ncbi:MAG: flagellar hook-length control protein FliK [Candidatus Hydrogenedentota bacterium]
MEIPPVLMQLLLAGQGLEKLFAATPGESIPTNAAEGQPSFAFALAQEVAPAVAAAVGKPVLILPDGEILLEFDASNLPPGGIVVSPPQTQIDYEAPVPDETVSDAESVEEEDVENAGTWSFPPMLGPPSTLSAHAKLLNEAATGSEELETPSAPWQSTAVYRVIEGGSDDAASLAKAGLSPEVWSVSTASESAGEASLVQATASGFAPDEVAGIEAKAMADAIVPAPKGKGIGGNYAALAKTAFVGKNAEVPPPVALRGMPPPVEEPEGLTQSAIGMSVPAKAVNGEAEATPLRQVLAYLTSEGVKLKLQTVESETGMKNASANAGKGQAVTAQAHSGGIAHEAVPEIQPGRGQTFPESGQASSDGPSEAGPKGAPPQTPKLEEFLVRHPEWKPVDASKVVVESSVVRSVPETPHIEMPRVPTETPLAQQPLEAASRISQPSGTAPAAGEAMEYSPTRNLALRDSMADLAVKSVRYLAFEGEKSLRVRLVPESLGEVRVELVSVRNELHLKLVSGNGAVREAMEQGSQMLRNVLARDGVNIVRVTVTPDGGVSDGSGSFSGKGATDGNAQYASRDGGQWDRPYGGDQRASDRRSARPPYHEGLLSLYA